MDASILDLRNKMRNVLSPLNRREKVRILYHGKVKGELIQVKNGSDMKTCRHPLFGLLMDEKSDPSDIVSKMRRKRRNDF